jgi:hypothetical protein
MSHLSRHSRWEFLAAGLAAACLTDNIDTAGVLTTAVSFYGPVHHLGL